VDILDFEGSVVDQDTGAKANPPRVIIWIVSPRALSATIEQRMESGIETQIIKVLRQLLRNRRIINAVKHAAIMASRITPGLRR
jgi:hypothetical protein